MTFRPTTVDRAFCRRCAAALLPALAASALAGCSALATPAPPPVHDSSLAPAGSMGYVVCSGAVTPVELASRTAEADISLPLSGSPALGNFAIAASGDGRWAYVVTSDGVSSGPTSGTGLPVGTTAAVGAPTTSSPPAAGVRNVVVPIDLVNQRARAPITIPGLGGTHAIVVLPGGRTVLTSSGSTLVRVDTQTGRVGAALDLGPGHTIFGMALDPLGSTLYALVAGGVIPVDTVRTRARAEIPTGLAVSSVNSPHGIVVSGDGATVYVVGQGGIDFGGRVLPIAVPSGATLPTAGFDRYGIADPAALALTADGASLLVVDSANNWVNPVPLATFTDPPPPIRLPQPSAGASAPGTQHPTDVVVGPGHSGAFLVDGFNSVLPYDPGAQAFGAPIPVCAGAASMVVAPAP